MTTIRNSIHPGLAFPTYPAPQGLNVAASISGDSTRRTDPPYFAQSVDSTTWRNSGQAVIGQIPANSQNPNVPGVTIDTEQISGKEDAFYHQHEGDVVRAAAIYLIHPVNQALSTHPNIMSTYKCLSEAATNRIRSDITYYKFTQQGTRPCAVVEFKKRGVIIENEFRAAAKVQQPPTAQQADAFIQQAMQARLEENTFFQGNSRILLKQASSYALEHNIKHVALFNWDFLVLIRFSQLDKANDFAGKYVETTVIGLNDSANMRKALLGFLVEAYNSV